MKAVSNTARSFICLNIAFVLWALTPLFAKLISIPVNPLISLRCGVAAATLAVLLKWRGISFALHSARDYAVLIATGVMMAFHWTLYFYSIRMSSVAIATIALCTGPVMSILLEPLINREPWHARDLVMGAVVFAGVCVLLPAFDLGNSATIGALFGVFSALLFSLRSILCRQLVRHYDSTLIMFYQVAVTFVLLLPTVVIEPPRFTGHDLPWLILLGIVFTALAHALYITSLTGLKVKTAGILQPVVPVYSTLFALFLMGDQPTLRTLVGGAIILSSAIYETAVGHRK